MSDALPNFELLRPKTVEQAVAALQTPGAQLLAGGTDLLVNLRKGLGAPSLLVDISTVKTLQHAYQDARGWHLGAGVKLGDLLALPGLAESYPALSQAAGLVAGPTHRTAATLGGNLCLDSRCHYYNQSQWWRQANDFCLKYKGDICHVAPKGTRCRAAYSGDIAPALMVLGATIELCGPTGSRQIDLKDFYREDGAKPLCLEEGEMLTQIHIPPRQGPSVYGKIRQRGAIDFPMAGVGVAAVHRAGQVQLRLAITGTNSKPLFLEPPIFERGEAAYLKQLGEVVQKAVSPQRTASGAPHYRRLSCAALAQRLAKSLL